MILYDEDVVSFLPCLKTNSNALLRKPITNVARFQEI